MPSTFSCFGPKCKAVHTIGVWAAAHMSEGVIHTCQVCGQKHDIQNWRVDALKDGENG